MCSLKGVVNNAIAKASILIPVTSATFADQASGCATPCYSGPHPPGPQAEVVKGSSFFTTEKGPSVLATNDQSSLLVRYV